MDNGKNNRQLVLIKISKFSNRKLKSKSCSGLTWPVHFLKERIASRPGCSLSERTPGQVPMYNLSIKLVQEFPGPIIAHTRCITHEYHYNAVKR